MLLIFKALVIFFAINVCGLSVSLAAGNEAPLQNNVFSANLKLMLDRVRDGSDTTFDDYNDAMDAIKASEFEYCERFVKSIQASKVDEVTLPTPVLSTAHDGNKAIRAFLLKKAKSCKAANPLRTMDSWLFGKWTNRSEINLYENPQKPDFLVFSSIRQGTDLDPDRTEVQVASFYNRGSGNDQCLAFEDSGQDDDLKGVAAFEGRIVIYASGGTTVQCPQDTSCRTNLVEGHRWFLRLYPPNINWKEISRSGVLREDFLHNNIWNMGYICTVYFD